MSRKRKPFRLSNTSIGRWQIGEGFYKNLRQYYKCICLCGEEREVRGVSLECGDSTSCGCKAAEVLSERQSKMKVDGFKFSEHPLYNVWFDMNRRCYDEKRKDYHHYGGRGIDIILRWRKSALGDEAFKNFCLDMYSSYKKGLEIDRRDNDKGYSLDNCKWATRRQQVINRRPTGLCFDTKLIEYQGQVKCLSEWAEVVKLPYRTLIDRLGKLNWTVEKAFTTPKKETL